MGDLGELAGALRRAASELESHGAIDCAGQAGHAYLVVLRDVTPVLTGELRASESVDSERGSGTRAVATIGAHTDYAAFRNDGGTITAKRFPQLGNPSAGWFGKSVTQAGSHYFASAGAAAQGPVADACGKVIDGILRDAGL